MSNLEPGCKAIVIEGVRNPEYPTNIGKIVVVGEYLGKFKNGSAWRVDQIMINCDGTTDYIQYEHNLQRIDGNEDTILTTEKELEVIS